MAATIRQPLKGRAKTKRTAAAAAAATPLNEEDDDADDDDEVVLVGGGLTLASTLALSSSSASHATLTTVSLPEDIAAAIAAASAATDVATARAEATMAASSPSYKPSSAKPRVVGVPRPANFGEVAALALGPGDAQAKKSVFQCAFEGCNKSYTSASHLRRHQKNHLDEKPYHCPNCEATFSVNHHLKYHMHTVKSCTNKHTKQTFFFLS